MTPADTFQRMPGPSASREYGMQMYLLPLPSPIIYLQKHYYTMIAVIASYMYLRKLQQILCHNSSIFCFKAPKLYTGTTQYRNFIIVVLKKLFAHPIK